MEFDPRNNIVKLCIQGMNSEEKLCKPAIFLSIKGNMSEMDGN